MRGLSFRIFRTRVPDDDTDTHDTHHALNTRTDPAVRGPAEQTLKQAELADFPAYVQALVKELVDASKAAPSRQMAGCVVQL
jgi:hypothetical protein